MQGKIDENQSCVFTSAGIFTINAELIQGTWYHLSLFSEYLFFRLRCIADKRKRNIRVAEPIYCPIHTRCVNDPICPTRTNLLVIFHPV
jgi:hypothetical protein